MSCLYEGKMVFGMCEYFGGVWNEWVVRDVCVFNLSSWLVSEKLVIDVLFVYCFDF